MKHQLPCYLLLTLIFSSCQAPKGEFHQLLQLRVAPKKMSTHYYYASQDAAGEWHKDSIHTGYSTAVYEFDEDGKIRSMERSADPIGVFSTANYVYQADGSIRVTYQKEPQGSIKNIEVYRVNGQQITQMEEYDSTGDSLRWTTTYQWESNQLKQERSEGRLEKTYRYDGQGVIGEYLTLYYEDQANKTYEQTYQGIKHDAKGNRVQMVTPSDKDDTKGLLEERIFVYY